MPKAAKVWKAFRYNKEGKLVFLFHGLNGTRTVTTGRWITAYQKMVTDGSGTTPYVSGFHCFLNEEEIVKWKRKTKLPSVVLPVEVKLVRQKWSNPNIGIARMMRIKWTK